MHTEDAEMNMTVNINDMMTESYRSCTEMSRFSDEELTTIYNDPGAGGILREALLPIVKAHKGSDCALAVKSRLFLERHFASDVDPLFIDDLFILAFLGTWSQQRSLSQRLSEAQRRDAKHFLSLPAMAYSVYDRLSSQWEPIPLDGWISAAEAVRWDRVVRGICIYHESGGSVSSMVARVDSPIWNYLGFNGSVGIRGAVFPFDRSARFRHNLSIVSKKDFVKLCLASGMPDPTSDIVNAARQMGKTRKASVNDSLGKSSLKDIKPSRSRISSSRGFKPDYSLREDADCEFDDAFQNLRSRESSIPPETAFLIGEYLRGLGGMISDHPIPTSVDEQQCFNASMSRYLSKIHSLNMQISLFSGGTGK